MVRFRYEKKEYTIFIEDVLVYPQCYGAIVDRLPQMSGQEIVVDIGSWTIDIMKVIDRVPDQATIATDPNGTERFMVAPIDYSLMTNIFV